MSLNAISSSKNFNLSSVRGLAALIVFFSHIIQVFWLRFDGLGTYLHLSSSFLSYYAVVVFFVLSGFLITHSVELNINLYKKLRLDVFLVARFARLYPPFIVAVILSIGIYFIMDYFSLPGRAGEMSLSTDMYSVRESINCSVTEILSALFLSHGLLDMNGPLWSLYIEAKLYVTFACIYSFLTGGRSFFVLVLFILTLFSGLRFNPEFMHYSAIWLTGCCAYYFFSKNTDRSKQVKKGIFFSLLIMFIIISEYVLYFYSDFISELPNTWKEVFFAFIISICIFRYTISISWLRYLGSFSYTLYVIHFPILLLVQSMLIYYGVTSTSFVLLISFISFFLVLAVSWFGRYFELKKEDLQNLIMSNFLWNKFIRYI